MWFHKIKRKKVQFIIIMVIMLLATGILTSCIAFAVETNRFTREMYRYDKCPIYYFVLGTDNGRKLIENSPAEKLTGRIETGNAKYMQKTMYINAKKMPNKSNFFYEVKDRKALHYPMPVLEGKDSKAPADDSIWICHIYAKAYHISVGNKIRFGKDAKKEYTVSGIVNTPQNNSGFISSYPFYVNQKTMKELDGKEAFYLNLYAKNASVTLKQVDEALPEAVTNAKLYSMDKDTLELCVSSLSGIFSGVGIAAALIMLIVMMIIIRYLVRATIEKEYSLIGIYKALGKSNREITKIYYFAYMISGVAGSILGLLLVRPFTLFLIHSLTGKNPNVALSYQTLMTGITVVAFMTVAFSINVLLELKKLSKISPIQAINLNAQSSKEKIGRSVIPNAYSSASIAVNSIFKNKGMNILTILVLTVSVYMELLAVGVGHTLASYDKDRKIWENLPDYSGYVKLKDVDKEKREEILQYLKNSEDVKDFVECDFDDSSDSFVYEGMEETSATLHPQIYRDFTSERYQNVPYTKGRICTQKHEITVSENFLKKTGKKVGDYLTITGNNRKKTDFLIVGSHSAKMQGGTSYYINYEDYKELGGNTILPNILIFLKPDVSFRSFEKKWDEKFQDVDFNKDFEFISQEGKTVGDIANPICTTLFLAFFAFSMLNVINLVYTQKTENRKKYGILKALGFTTGYIRREMMIRLTIEFAVAIFITVILHNTLSPVLFSLACGVYFIRKPIYLMVLVCLLTYVVLMFAVAVMLWPVKKIQPVELMEE